MTLKIDELLAEAMNGELASYDSDEIVKIALFLKEIISVGVSRYWTLPALNNRIAWMSEFPHISRFVVGNSERFIMLTHQAIVQEPLLSGKDVSYITALETTWWKGQIDSIVELRNSFIEADTLSDNIAAELTYPEESLRQQILENHWMLTLYLGLINGTFNNVSELLEEQ